MNQLKKQLVCLAIAVSASSLFGDGGTTSKIIPRSQSFNAARQMVGWNNPEWGINRYPEDTSYASMNLTFAYTRTFRSKDLTRALFGDDVVCGECDNLGIKISGSAVADRASTDWLAEYFGLARDFQSTVSFKPTISNFILDFSFYAGLDSWVDGMYFRIHGPYVHTKWNLNAQESVCNAGEIGYFQGYFSSAAVPASNLTQRFLDYSNGCATPIINNDYSQNGEYDCQNSLPPFDTLLPLACSLPDITWQSLCCSKISNDCDCSGLSRNGFAELRFVLGYNFLDDINEQYHAGLGIYAAAPTGTKIGQTDEHGQGRYLFEPIVGNGKHWELGAQITAHHIFWNSKDNDKSLGVYVETNVSHLFAASQIRCFDLVSAGSNSRYMLAERLDAKFTDFPEVTIFGPAQFSTTATFANEYAPVANLTRRNVVSSIAVQGDIAVTLAYQTGNFQWDIGYNFWGRTCENICIDNCCPIDNGTWALKGDERVYGFYEFTSDILATTLPISDSRATINTGSNMANGISYAGTNPTEPVNQFSDNSVRMNGVGNQEVYILPDTTSAFIYRSKPTVFIEETDFDLTGTRGTSNKVFTNFNWTWDSNTDAPWTPYVGFGGELEFGSSNNSCCSMNNCESECNTDCNSCNTGCGYEKPKCTALPRRPAAPAKCIDCALSQWGLWFKIGASYN